MVEDAKTLAKERCEVVVDSNQVADFSSRGYRTIEIRDEEICTHQYLSDQVVPDGTTYPVLVTKQVPVTTRLLKFFMVRDGESRIAELSKELDEHKADTKKLMADNTRHSSMIASLESTRESLKQDIERRRVLLEKELAEKEELKKRLRLMEGDIAKFRKEIGEQRWREITAPETTP